MRAAGVGDSRNLTVVLIIVAARPLLLNVDKQRSYFLFKECPCGSDHHDLDLGLQRGMDSG